MVVKTFRGLLANDAEDRIRLHTLQGKVGYRIIKFQVIGDSPVLENQESVVKIYTVPGKTIVETVDFSEADLLAVGVWTSHSTATIYPDDMTIIFDTEVFNQDIYISQTDTSGRACNYYLELEVIPLTEQGAEYTTIKDLRANA